MPLTSCKQAATARVALRLAARRLPQALPAATPELAVQTLLAATLFAYFDTLELAAEERTTFGAERLCGGATVGNSAVLLGYLA